MTRKVQRQPYNPYGRLPDDVLGHINQISWKVSIEFGHSNPEDLAQDAWLWVGAFPRQSAKWWYLATDGNTKFSYRQFRRDVQRCCATLARKDKARAIGYEPEDQQTYSAKMIERYLPYVWHSDVLAAIQDVQEGPSAKADPSLGGDAMVSAMDVRKAYRGVIRDGSTWDQALYGVFAIGLTQSELGEAMGVDRTTIGRYVSSAIHAMAEFLNGTEGFSQRDMPGHTLGDGPGSRKTINNATAQALNA